MSSPVAIITGAAQGIGYSIALRLADDGYDIALNDLESKAAQLEELSSAVANKGRKAIVVIADVSTVEGVQKLVNKTVEVFGQLDVMVANAGVHFMSSLVTMKVEDWDHLYAVNVRGVMLCYQAAAIQMIKQGKGGRIIGGCSGAGKKGLPLISAYSSSKYAIRGLTQSAASELLANNITVNAYAPGIVQTPMTVKAEEMARELAGSEGGASFRDVLGVPNLHVPGPEVCSSLVSFLVKPESYHITGQTINVNGGYCFD